MKFCASGPVSLLHTDTGLPRPAAVATRVPLGAVDVVPMVVGEPETCGPGSPVGAEVADWAHDYIDVFMICVHVSAARNRDGGECDATLASSAMTRPRERGGAPVRIRVGVTGHRTLGDPDPLATRESARRSIGFVRVCSSPDEQIPFTVISSLAEGADRP